MTLEQEEPFVDLWTNTRRPLLNVSQLSGRSGLLTQVVGNNTPPGRFLPLMFLTLLSCAAGPLSGPGEKKKPRPIFAADVLGQREERLLSQGLLRRQRCRLLFEEDEQFSAPEPRITACADAVSWKTKTIT